MKISSRWRCSVVACPALQICSRKKTLSNSYFYQPRKLGCSSNVQEIRNNLQYVLLAAQAPYRCVQCKACLETPWLYSKVHTGSRGGGRGGGHWHAAWRQQACTQIAKKYASAHHHHPTSFSPESLGLYCVVGPPGMDLSTNHKQLSKRATFNIKVLHNKLVDTFCILLTGMAECPLRKRKLVLYPPNCLTASQRHGPVITSIYCIVLSTPLPRTRSAATLILS